MFHGSMVAIVTPMEDDGAIDFRAMAELIEFHVENQTDAIVVAGTTGESATLDMQEHCHLIRESIKLVDGRVPVIAGTGANSTTEAIELTRCAMEAGADAALLVTPYYNKPMQEGLYLHFKAVADAVPIPQMLYNVPGRTACDLLPETIIRLAKIPNIIGVKEATGDLDRVNIILDACGDSMDIISGDDTTGMELMLRGGKGVISVTSNIAPQAMHDMCVAALAGDEARTREINKHLDPLHESLFIESSPIPVKWALYEMGLIGPGIRLPLTPLNESLRSAFRETLEAAGVLLKTGIP
jgi:4-hydroxy-tetrahydrodipicolinate synthase